MAEHLDYQLWSTPPQTQIWAKDEQFSQNEKDAIEAVGGEYDPKTGSYYVKILGMNEQRAEAFVRSLETQ